MIFRPTLSKNYKFWLLQEKFANSKDFQFCSLNLAQISVHKPTKCWKFSVPQTLLSQTKISSLDPHFGTLHRTSLPKQKLSAPWAFGTRYQLNHESIFRISWWIINTINHKPSRMNQAKHFKSTINYFCSDKFACSSSHQISHGRWNKITVAVKSENYTVPCGDFSSAFIFELYVYFFNINMNFKTTWHNQDSSFGGPCWAWMPSILPICAWDSWLKCAVPPGIDFLQNKLLCW